MNIIGKFQGAFGLSIFIWVITSFIHPSVSNGMPVVEGGFFPF
jgi:hypothetical protein